jgi:hypothetical protein
VIGQGIDVIISRIFLRKKLAKKLAKNLAFFTQTTASFLQKLNITTTFQKNANYFAENWQKIQKIVIITLTQDVHTYACVSIIYVCKGKLRIALFHSLN